MTTYLTIRLTKKLKARIDARAKSLDLTTSQLVRRWIEMSLQFDSTYGPKESSDFYPMDRYKDRFTLMSEMNERLKNIETILTENR